MNALEAAARSILSRLLVLGIAVAALTACGGVTELTEERVASSGSAVRQAEQTVGNSESGALELQRAKDHLQQAHRAVEDNEDQEAQRQAHQATLMAELAVSKSQSAEARRAADELLASIETLRREAGLESGDRPPR
ncbi:MAG: DUF4398 domain-containing protein [Steroidobacteraceae bacterium]|jgi:hypothetical protein|nr:DUF4398 domain-containing protein [Steroidobacteraceae bacterium]